jgi:putative ABC transport system ATP-binding protein
MTLVQIRDVHKSYETGGETTKVLYDLDLNMKKGEMVMIMGPSGSGKTTLLNIMGGIDKANKGTVRIADDDLMALNTRELNGYRRDKVGFIFQFYNLIPTLNATENVELGLESIIKDKKEMRERAVKYLKLVGLDDKLKNFPQELSGGQQQRVAVARALAKEPAIILADEPTGNVDEAREQQIMELMNKLQHELHITFLVVSHNRRLEAYVDRTLILRKGSLKPEKNN